MYAAKAGGICFIVFGIVALIGATMWIRPGVEVPRRAAHRKSAPLKQPDWFMAYKTEFSTSFPGSGNARLHVTEFELEHSAAGDRPPGLMFEPFAASCCRSIEAWVTVTAPNTTSSSGPTMRRLGPRR